jgi:hypothetical protein
MIFSKIRKELGVDLVDIQTLGDVESLNTRIQSDLLMSPGIPETTKSGFFFLRALPSSYLKFLGLKSCSPRARKVSISTNFKAYLKLNPCFFWTGTDDRYLFGIEPTMACKNFHQNVETRIIVTN